MRIWGEPERGASLNPGTNSRQSGLTQAIEPIDPHPTTTKNDPYAGGMIAYLR
jgi:hypothetical protein